MGKMNSREKQEIYFSGPLPESKCWHLRLPNISTAEGDKSGNIKDQLLNRGGKTEKVFKIATLCTSSVKDCLVFMGTLTTYFTDGKSKRKY